MAAYVLVHGAWHGGWCWKRVLPALQGPGVEIHTPTLTGLGERAHLASRDVSLETHIQDVMGVIESERLADVILVGHSYAGVVVTAVADRMPQRISRLVYLDALVPKSGQSLYDCAGRVFRERIEGLVKTQGEGWYIPLPTAERMGLFLQEDIDFTMPRLVPHPARTFCGAREPEGPLGEPRAAHLHQLHRQEHARRPTHGAGRGDRRLPRAFHGARRDGDGTGRGGPAPAGRRDLRPLNRGQTPVSSD